MDTPTPDEEDYRMVGFSINKLALVMYNVAGKPSEPFYEHWSIFEYEVDGEERCKEILFEEWGYTADLVLTVDDSYIDIYETKFGSSIALSNKEFNELIVMSDGAYEQAYKYMSSLYDIVVHQNYIIRNKQLQSILQNLFIRYTRIFKIIKGDVLSTNKYLSNIAAFICMIDDEEI